MARTSVHANASGLDAVQLAHPAGMAAALKLGAVSYTHLGQARGARGGGQVTVGRGAQLIHALPHRGILEAP